MKRFFLFIGSIILVSFIFVFYYYDDRWSSLWALETPMELYPIKHKSDDTLRVVMIGDSWVGMRNDTINLDFQRSLLSLICKPIKVKTRGRGGEKSRGIYKYLFEYGEYGTRGLMEESPDYCVIFAGINDAASNRGTKQFLHHYRLILQFLVDNNIQPVVVEIPDVNIWKVKKEKPIKDLIGDYVKSIMTNCGLYRYNEYREDLNAMLNSEKFINKVVFVPMIEWNGGSRLKTDLFLDDQIHLNSLGYAKMDSCIAVHIANHYCSR